jgi:hypothetical protein
MTNPARNLVALAIVAAVVALVFASAGVLLYRAALGPAQTRVHPVNAPTIYRVPA